MSINNRQHGFIKTNGVNLHYVSQGEGKLMLMLHGFPEFWYSWRYQIAEFSPDYHVVAIDMRGYNDSDKPGSLSAYKMSELIADVEGVIAGLGYENCILVAHDWGGGIAWNFADQNPKMVSKLIVMNLPHPAKFMAGLKTWKQLQKSWYIFFFQIPVLPELIFKANNYQKIASTFMDMAIDKSAFTSEDLSAYQEAAAKPGALTAMINYYRANFKDLPDSTATTYGVLDVPTLMIWGEEDTALGKELTYGTKAYVKDLKLKYIPNCSHWVQQEKPKLVNQYMRDFLLV
ncbi:alpha/beta hydrolase [Waterburya agarophytonicola K14]|uniref:Alpha/beta hydrolase n=1 Tax=Waterburya agarophytonicola KI4 TaxID=2874699 RepID=A0A964BW16_9CYAN|nr:alpha/beta hydrolase [Waterburya agarophytonicola]MCC0179288.1 alpha/beta hydrolase [Waterburya agarophytonicola KI4]